MLPSQCSLVVETVIVASKETYNLVKDKFFLLVKYIGHCFSMCSVCRGTP